MTTVFLSGSRKLSRINDAIRSRIDNMIDNELDIMAGDANGADKAMQTYLAERKYPNVTVFYVGSICRNNVGNWNTKNVSVNPGLSGRQFYSQKDKKMAEIADFGLVLWDGKSAGSVENIFEIIQNGKKAIVYYSPEKSFYKVLEREDIDSLLNKCDKDIFANLDRKLGFAQMFREIDARRQTTLNLV